MTYDKSVTKLEVSSLYPLAFGSSISRIERSANALQDRMSSSQGWESRYDVVGSPLLFATKTASVELPGLRLTAVSHSPFRSKVISKKTSTFVLPFAGERSVSQINGQSIAMTPGLTAAFAPPGERVGSGGYRSVLMIDVDTERLQKTWSIICGQKAVHGSKLDVDTPRELSLSAFGGTFEHMCSIVDQFCSVPQTLVKLGVDESFYRMVALQMGPDGVADQHNSEKADLAMPKRLEQTCQYIMAHLSEAITLTDLERVANLSSRSLQYAFLKKFNCTPMQWVREQRLIVVQRCLATAGPDATVSSIAMSFGFSSLSKFSAGYAARFGELPSVTMGQSPNR